MWVFLYAFTYNEYAFVCFKKNVLNMVMHWTITYMYYKYIYIYTPIWIIMSGIEHSNICHSHTPFRRFSHATQTQQPASVSRTNHIKYAADDAVALRNQCLGMCFIRRFAIQIHYPSPPEMCENVAKTCWTWNLRGCNVIRGRECVSLYMRACVKCDN